MVSTVQSGTFVGGASVRGYQSDKFEERIKIEEN